MVAVGRSAKSTRRRMTRKVCRVCGKEFWSTGENDICVKPSTCRVKEHQIKLAAKKLAQTMMLDFGYYAAFVRVTAVRPTLKTSLEQFIIAHGIPAAKENIAILERLLKGEI